MRIKKLSTIVANQIAAGEVIERPVSIIKELVENSLDAGSDSIDIKLVNGGKSLISIKDNGDGIFKDDLKLSLVKHATSKITTSNDLLYLSSLGFRGEALSSICSISRIMISSIKNGEKQGWQIYNEFDSMDTNIKLSNILEGTLIEVRDMFYNIPARLKFLKSDKTEYINVEKLITAYAISNPHVSFSLSHNGKLLKKFNRVTDNNDVEKRLSLILGKRFIDNNSYFKSTFEKIVLSGWVVNPDINLPSCQFVFLNGRVIKDKVVNHAIKQAYKRYDIINQNYIIFVDLPKDQVDINVHPSKYEVRFSNNRILHDFLVSTLSNMLIKNHKIKNEVSLDLSNDNQCTSIKEHTTTNYKTEEDEKGCIGQQENIKLESLNSYPSLIDAKRKKLEPSRIHYFDAYERNETQNSLTNNFGVNPENRIDNNILGKPITLINGYCVMLTCENRLKVVSLLKVSKALCAQKIKNHGLESKPLLIPYKLNFNELVSNKQRDYMEVLGFKFKLLENYLTFTHVPNILKDKKLDQYLEEFVRIFCLEQNFIFKNNSDLFENFTDFIVKQAPKINNLSEAIHMIACLESEFEQETQVILDTVTTELNLEELIGQNLL
ncbi:hypothetical protein CF386_04090 [Paraphotobacterium marinum]|uniref:DNA mismatch repair protein MutL n=1 Tax=Paraphotobacterium marinum TaxID=1755811 RepID=A0A220VD38_9GAMM|nr:DNA mismatch repair endonuclease MutL [Paraphotobacterium marinum]ASK78257.1 hypothetical protein CF386_04090 [Paraphotobacterium marinum]